MQIATESSTYAYTSEDPEVAAAKNEFYALIGDLLYLPQISSVQEFTVEYSAILSEAAAFIVDAYAAMEKITDPAILSSAAYKTMLADLTKNTTPSLYDAAKNPDPSVLARVLLEMKGTGVQPLSIAQFNADMNRFDRL